MLRSGNEMTELVAHHALENYIDAQQVQLLGQVERVGIDAVGSEHFGSHRDSFGIHALRV
jgi:hypothetical protein